MASTIAGSSKRGSFVRNLSITTKIVSSVLVVALLLGLVQLFMVTRLASQAQAAQNVYDVGVVPVSRVADVERTFLLVRIATTAVATTSDPEVMRGYIDALGPADDALTAARDSLNACSLVSCWDPSTASTSGNR